MDIPLRLLLVALIIAGNAFFVIAEYALVTARRSALQERANAGSAAAARVLRLLDDPVGFISTVQIGITGLGILLGAVGEPTIRALLGDAVSTWISLAVGFLVVTYLSVAFGELVPKALALHAAEPIAMLVATPIDVLSRVFAPAVWVLQVSARAVLRPLGVPPAGAGDRPMSREELRVLMVEAEEHGTLRAEEEDMIAAVMDLGAREARDIMVPWEEVETVDVSRPAEEILALVVDGSHMRYPALEAGGAVGTLHARDAWRAERSGDVAAHLRASLREPVIVPPTIGVGGLVHQLRGARQQLAVVVSEYGAPLGIATLEDAVEELVGEIEDEFDAPDRRIEPVGDGSFLVDARVSISDFNRHSGAALTAERARTLGGLVLDALGRRPQQGDEVRVGEALLRVEELDGHRIRRLGVRLPPIVRP